MQSLIQVTLEILRAMPLVLNPGVSPFFWPVLLIVFLQYRRIAGMEKKMHGHVLNPPLPRLLSSMAYGAGAGLVGSLMLVMLGVSLQRQDVMYLLPVALLLMLVHPRLLCFSYAGGIVSISHLVLGWPDVNVAAIMGLVAVLHLVEGLLVMWGGDGCRTPVFVETLRGQVVGGFTMQRFWPLPLIILILLQIDVDLAGRMIDMPSWWPLVAPRPESVTGANWVNIMLPVTAALGYGDIALTTHPTARARITARHLLAYSMLLFAASVAASRVPALMWVAAVLGPGAHELMVRRGGQAEFGGKPMFTPPRDGVMILERLPGHPAHAMGLEPGDIILSVNGAPVGSGADLSAQMALSGDPLELELVQGGRVRRVRHRWDAVGNRRLGVFLVPDPGARPHFTAGGQSPLARLVGRLVGGGRSHDRS